MSKFTNLFTATNATNVSKGSLGRVTASIPAASGARIYVVSCSVTTDATNPYVYFQDATYSRVYATQTTNTATTLASAALFDDIRGTDVSGTGIPANTIVSARADASNATLSRASTNTGTNDLTYTGLNMFHLDIQSAGSTFTNFIFTPPIPIPISLVGNAGRVVLDTSSAGRVSVTYAYAI